MGGGGSGAFPRFRRSLRLLVAGKADGRRQSHNSFEIGIVGSTPVAHLKNPGAAKTTYFANTA
jgi:hypothetical protein